jgi:NAD(P)-dependent dehydrogenase (short-subunit alcohol dehydrogenase family)
LRLSGAHALITGGGTGIGAAIAASLADEGCRVTLVGRRPEPLHETASQIRNSRRGARSAAGSVFVHTADVTARAEVDDAFEAARIANGPITILVHSAGASASGPFGKASLDTWRSMLAVNLDGLFHCCQAALGDLLQAKNGRIVAVASTASVKGYAYTAPYCAAKHGALGLIRALAAEFARTRLTANTVCPGFTDTAIVSEAVALISSRTSRSEDEARDELKAFNPQQRLIEPQEVASAVAWLCLPESRSINGQAVAVAGGEI